MASSNQGNQGKGGNQGSKSTAQQNTKSGNQTTKGSNQGNSSERGFAAMDPDRQREIASEGGKAAHEIGNAHEFTSEEAREAGRKGVQASSGDSNQGNQGSNKGENQSGNQGGNQGGKR